MVKRIQYIFLMSAFSQFLNASNSVQNNMQNNNAQPNNPQRNLPQANNIQNKDALEEERERKLTQARNLVDHNEYYNKRKYADPLYESISIEDYDKVIQKINELISKLNGVKALIANVPQKTSPDLARLAKIDMFLLDMSQILSKANADRQKVIEIRREESKRRTY